MRKGQVLCGLNIPNSCFFQREQRVLRTKQKPTALSEPFVHLKLSLDISTASVCNLETILITPRFSNVPVFK